MTIPVSLRDLKRVKNSVIGNPAAKVQLANDNLFIQQLVDCLNSPSAQEDVRIEAAVVISSISYGSEDALGSLLRAEALRAFLYAISKLGPSDSIPLRSAFARALRAIAAAVADTVGPSQWGLRPDTSSIRTEAKIALDHLFHIDSLDIFLPLLVDTSPQTSTSIAQLLASAVRSHQHRKAATEWLPPSERMKEIKTKRGWEKTPTTSTNSPARQGGWVARNLTALLRSRNTKLQEAALSGLAAIAKDNPPVATTLSKSMVDREMPAPLSSVLSLSKSRSIDVQLAACLCATHIIRGAPHTIPTDNSAARTVMNVVNRIIADENDTSQNRTKACFILYYLINDDTVLSHIAYERSSLEKLADLVRSCTPQESDPEHDEDEPESKSQLREAALTAVASIALFDNDIRRSITDDLQLLRPISVSLGHRHNGVRYAACQCIRVLSRAVAVLRTNIVDTGLGLAVFEIFKKENEDRRVLSAALSAVCNIVNEFSPLKSIYLEQGLMPRLVQLLGNGDSTLRLSALWAVKNLLRKTSLETKREVMEQLGWTRLSLLLKDPDEAVQEQAFNVVRNIAEDEDSIDMIFEELGSEALLSHVATSLRSSDDDVVLQAAYVLANLANAHESHQESITSHREILVALQRCIAESKTEIRRPAVACILELARNHPERRKVLADAGIVSTLHHICEWGGGMSLSPGGRPMSLSGHPIVAEDRDLIDQAKLALDWLEHTV
ncbi:ARM repeat-containing protein [Mycena floridula]|nr:ARM repeat-containing protein [Mycena floridula]